ncbi:solute carrier family 22 member 2-like isoform X1 [Scylla paramamosain]|uniref:solute carrier family 22 member 2-like isoform X1 n=1 Tax=Scylla paramamosain TaxID=85552 RepID=UPI003082D3F8
MEDIRKESADSCATKRERRWQKVWDFLETFVLLIRTRRIRKITLILFCCYFITSMGYVGLSLGGDLFSSNPFIYVAISGLVEIPGATFTIPLVEQFGRRFSNMAFYLLTGACLLALPFIPTYIEWISMTLALLGKMALTAAYQVLFLHSGELFPTEVRTWGMGNSSTMARIGSVFSSFLVSVIPSSWSIAPFIILGCSCLIAAWATSLLPETRGAALYDTVAALEAAQSFKGDKEKEEEGEIQQRTTITTTTAAP